MTRLSPEREQYDYGRNPYQLITEMKQGVLPILTVLGKYGRDWSQADRDLAMRELEAMERRAVQLREQLAGYYSTAFRVVTEQGRGRVVLDTDDWVEAQRHAIGNPYASVLGVHPSHTWPEGVQRETISDAQCTTCGAWHNGSYGSQAPCGYDFGGRSLAQEIVRILEAQEVANG